jgi:hypothetical protein
MFEAKPTRGGLTEMWGRDSRGEILERDEGCERISQRNPGKTDSLRMDLPTDYILESNVAIGFHDGVLFGARRKGTHREYPGAEVFGSTGRGTHGGRCPRKKGLLRWKPWLR